MANETFPHESTADQWFSESQFESYRSLALDIMNTMLVGEEEIDHGSLKDILARPGADGARVRGRPARNGAPAGDRRDERRSGR